MHKFAATVLALALATTHGLLDEGGPVVQDAPKGIAPKAKAGSARVREGRVGRKLNMGYISDDSIVNEPTGTPTAAPTSEPSPAPTKNPVPEPTPFPTPQPAPVWKSKFRGAFVPNRRVDLHAVDAASVHTGAHRKPSMNSRSSSPHSSR